MRALKVIFFVLFVVYFTSSSFAQVKPVGVPFITNYTNEEYGGANQNFAVIQDNRGVMYFGNSVILEFDGTHWRQIYTPNLSFTYSFAKDSTGRIYVGAANGELGYLGADSIGNMKYISLADKIPEEKHRYSTLCRVASNYFQ